MKVKHLRAILDEMITRGRGEEDLFISHPSADGRRMEIDLFNAFRKVENLIVNDGVSILRTENEITRVGEV